MIDCSFNWSELREIAGPHIRPGGSILTEKALKVCNLSHAALIADIGCGPGGTMEHLEQAGFSRVVGLDYSETLLGEAVPRLVSARLVRGMAETLPFKKGSFDALFCECVLSILDDGMAALGEVTRTLKNGGYLVASDVFRRGQGYTEQKRLTGELREFGTNGFLVKDDLISILTGLGFSLLLWEEHEKYLKEFIARMILAGRPLQSFLACNQGEERKTAGPSGISYFLLVAQKTAGSVSPAGTKGEDKS